MMSVQRNCWCKVYTELSTTNVIDVGTVLAQLMCFLHEWPHEAVVTTLFLEQYALAGLGYQPMTVPGRSFSACKQT